MATLGVKELNESLAKTVVRMAGTYV